MVAISRTQRNKSSLHANFDMVWVKTVLHLSILLVKLYPESAGYRVNELKNYHM